MREYIAESKYGVSQESVLFGFRENGNLPNSDIGTKPDTIPLNLDFLSNAKLDTLCNKITQYPFAQSILNRIRHSRPDFLSSREDKIGFLRCCFRQQLKIGKDFGSCALCSEITLAPGEKKNIRFLLTWYFPNLKSLKGEILGHYYENLYSSALGANKFLSESPSTTSPPM